MLCVGPARNNCEVPGIGNRTVFSPKSPDRLWGALILLFSAYRGIFSPEVKRPGRETDILPVFSAEVKERLGLHVYCFPACLQGVHRVYCTLTPGYFEGFFSPPRSKNDFQVNRALSE